MSKWAKMRLGDCCEITSSKRCHLSERVKVGVPFYRSKEIIQRFNGEPVEACDCIEESTYLDIERRYGVPKSGDLLVTTRGSVGVPCLYTEKDRFYFADGNLTWFRNFKPLLNSCYLYYWFQSSEGRYAVTSIAVGTAQLAVPISGLKLAEILLPPIEYQRKVAVILSDYDSAIDNARRQIALLDESAMRLYREWFSGAPSREWSKSSILDNEIFQFVSSPVKRFPGERIYYATADVSGTALVGSGERITFVNRPSRAAIQPIADSVWFSRMSNSYKILLFSGDASLADRVVLSSGFAGFTSRPEWFGFVYYYIASKEFDEAKNRFATGATQVSLTNAGLAKVQVSLPPKALVEKYSTAVRPIFDEGVMLRKKIKNLTEARDRLLPKLMSGEIEV